MKKIAAVLLSVGMFSSLGFAVDRHSSRYICRSDDGSTFVRIFPRQMRAEIDRTDGRPSYDLTCEQGNGNNWLECTGDDGRTINFHRGGRSATYYGSVRTTELFCSPAGHGSHHHGGW